MDYFMSRQMLLAEQAKMEVWKAAEKERIRIQADNIRVQNRANVASLRELQKLKIDISDSGAVKLEKELFGTRRYEEASFQIMGFCIWRCEERGSVLVVKVQASKDPVIIYFSRANMEPSQINKKFNAAGVKFGFSHAKETGARLALVEEMLNVAPTYLIASRPGWYKSGEEIGYAFPGEATWAEVEP